MSKQESIEQEGVVLQELGNSMFKVALNGPAGIEVLCTISGKIRKSYIRILVGDRVKVEMSPYDLTKGRISYRLPATTQTQPVVNNSNNKNKSKRR